MGDITTDEMKVIFNETKDYVLGVNSFARSTQRTCLPLVANGLFLDYNGLAYGSLCKVLLSNFYYPSAGIIFRGTPRLEHICGKMDIHAIKLSTLSLNEIQNLKTIQLYSINKSIDLNQGKMLSSKSILYMINNETSTSPITITLHAEAYARAMANADIVAALEAHPNISLASA